MVSACSRAGRGSTRRAYRPKVPKADPKAAASAHQDQQHEAPSKKKNKGATLKSDKSEPAVNPPPGLECVFHANQIQEEVLDQMAPEQVCKTSVVEPPPGLERVSENLPAKPETVDPAEIQEAISESDDVATVTENPPYPFHVKDVSECAACSGNVLAPIACCVSIEGLPNAILSEPMVLAMLQQAGLLEEVIRFSTCEGDPCGEVQVSFSSVDAALRCVYHFKGCQWNASGTEVTTKMTPLESSESLESLDYALGMDAAVDYVCCSAMEGEEHLGAMTREQAFEIPKEEAGAVLQEHAGATLSAEAAEFVSCDAESQQPPCVFRADAPAFELTPSDPMVFETLLPEAYEMADAEACDFMTAHGSDCMLAFAGEVSSTSLSAESPPFVPCEG